MIGLPELILIGLVLIIGAGAIALLVWGVMRLSRASQAADQSPLDPKVRLELLNDLKARGEISDEEYREKRRQLVGEI